MLLSLSNGMDPLLPLTPLPLKDFRSAGEGDVLMHLSSCRPLGTGVCRKGKSGVKQQNFTDKPNTSIIGKHFFTACHAHFYTPYTVRAVS